MKTTKQFRIKIRKTLSYALILILSITLFTSCGKDDDTPPATLSSISPMSGPKTTIVTINGSNFGTTLDKVKVYFNDVQATVQAVTSSQITATVPAKAYTGLVKVVVNGNELIGPEFNYTISDIQVSTVAGSILGFEDGDKASSKFAYPEGITVDSQGNLFVADYGNHIIRKISTSGVVTTLAGSTSGFADGTGTGAKFNYPIGLTIDGKGNIYVADTGNHKIRKITQSGEVSSLAGSTSGFVDATGKNAKFYTPSGIAIDNQGNLYVADTRNYKIRKITQGGVVSTLMGSTQGFADGSGANVKFNLPEAITIDGQSNLYIVDTYRIRIIYQNGDVRTLAGSTEGFADGTGSNAKFYSPFGIAIDDQGNVYVADTYNHKIRKITPTGEVSTIAGGTEGFADGKGAYAKFNYPFGLTIDIQGNLYVTDSSNHKIRKITQE